MKGMVNWAYTARMMRTPSTVGVQGAITLCTTNLCEIRLSRETKQP